MIVIVQIAQIVSALFIIPLFGWILLVERRLSRIEGYCKGRNCAPESGK